MWLCNNRYINYEVHSTGEIRDTVLGNIINPKKNRSGYLTVYLPYAPCRCRKRTGEKVYTHTLHRVVAAVHLPPPRLGQTIVDHIDGDRTNCDVTNLRWLSPSANNYNRRDTRGYSSHKYQNGVTAKAPVGFVFPVIWVRGAKNKRFRIYGAPVLLEHALEVSKLIRENLIALMCQNPLCSSAGLLSLHSHVRK